MFVHINIITYYHENSYPYRFQTTYIRLNIDKLASIRATFYTDKYASATYCQEKCQKSKELCNYL